MKSKENPVQEIIRERSLSFSTPFHRRDDYKLGLVIQGGAMRGIWPAGMAYAIGVNGLLPVFDAVYGVSAGAVVGSYLLSQQEEGLEIFEHINNNHFINNKRFLMRKPIVNISYLTHHIMKDVVPLDWERVIDSPIPLHVFVTDARTAEPIDFNEFSNQEDLLNILGWSCRMPVLAGKPIRVGDDYYTDGAVSIGAIPTHEAIADGCSHILVLQSQSETERERVNAQNELTLFSLLGYYLMKEEFPAAAQAVLRVEVDYMLRMHEIAKASQNPGEEPPYALGVNAIGGPPVSVLERNVDILRRGALAGKKGLEETLGISNRIRD